MKKGFDIICLKCGSKTCSIRTNYDFIFDGEEEHLIELGQYIYCENCENTEDL